MDDPRAIETDAYRRLEQSDLDWTTWDEKEAFYGELKGYAEERGYKPGFAALKYRTRFGEYPNDKHVRDAAARPCGPATRLWIKASQEGFWRTKRRR
jgi:DNA repair protein RadD